MIKKTGIRNIQKKTPIKGLYVMISRPLDYLCMLSLCDFPFLIGRAKRALYTALLHIAKNIPLAQQIYTIYH